ncbi:S1C family serine protease [Magnetovibrio sp.]|uniref:S1C family serine protease n=1 Tax=Magnetovibrio sp. TaxID=2024836 RepID=UPI002F91DFDB
MSRFCKPFHAAMLVGLVSLGLAGCNMTTSMAIPKVQAPEGGQLRPHQELAPITFEKAIAGLKRGRVIAHYPGVTNAKFDATLCNQTYSNDARLEWGSGSALLGGWTDELAEIFNETMSQSGLNVVGDPKELFEVTKSRQAAKYRVAARMVDIRGNVCEEHHWWDGRPLRKYAAEFYQKIEWSVYSNFERRVVANIATEGVGRQDRATPEGIMVAFNSAFVSATEALAADKSFLDLISRGGGGENRVHKGPDNAFSALVLSTARLSVEPFQNRVADAIESTVTVRAGSGHGSGFVVSGEGYILTNHHVVGDAGEVAVVFNTGVEVNGTVVRKDPVRDVALIQVPLRKLQSLPIRTRQPLKRLDVVYAIGSPIEERLKSTVTRGIVSAFRTEDTSALPLIQSDVDISAGNSGGPLLDQHGNVVGISVAGYSADSFSSGLNLFIPIDSALEFLNITVDGG